ncbi:MAG TPA: aminotransferase class IV [Terriglobia bacterium]|nr:aminotransferase class IV [Terriglobia bacterium]
MLHRFVYRNDRLVSMQEVRLSPGQAGLLNGWGVFTTIRIYDGWPFAFDRHWNRLTTDANRLKIPSKWQPENVLDRLGQLIEANHVKEGCARIYLIYNRAGAWVSDEAMPEVDLILYTADLPRRVGPVRLAVQPYGRYASSPLAGVKVTSWLENVWMLDQALRRGFDEVILLNEHNEVTECTAANIFCVRNGEVTTSPLSAGCLPGVSRAVLLEMGEQFGARVMEATIRMEDLFAAEEVFITSTTREVQPVSQIEDRTIAQAGGPVTQRLAKAFSQYVEQSLLKSKTRTAN